MFGFKPEKLETPVRLCKARLQLQKNKKTIAVKAMRKEVAELLRTGKQEYARIRVEGVIRENLLMQAYEILELYLELVAVRAQLIAKTKEIPRDMVEAISSIIYAAQRISDVPELLSLRQLFQSKYSKEYVQEASSDVACTKWQVNNNLIRCLLVEPPQPEDKLQMLSEIAQEHGVEWDLSAAARDLLPPGGPGGMNGGGGGGGAPNGVHDAGLPPPLHHLHPPGASGPSGTYAGGAPPMMGQPAPPVGQAALMVPQGITDPQQAAAAAAAAAAHARAMAEWANDLAVHYAVQTNPMPLPQGPPPEGWLASSSMGHSAMPPAAAAAAGSSSSAGGPAPVRSDQDIQRAYDAAVGPPAKGAGAAGPSNQRQHAAPPPAVPILPPPPPPPPVPPQGVSGLPSVPAVLPSAPAKDVDPTMPNLPRPPKGLGQAAGEDEYDELSRRLDALKRT